MKTLSLVSILLLSVSLGCSKKPAPDGGGKPKGYVLDQAPKIAKPLDVDFDGKVQLIGYQAPKGALKPNQKVKVTLYWKVKEKLNGDWKLSTQLVDGSGERLLNLDNKSPIRAGAAGRAALPPTSWVPGKVYVDEISFKMPRRVKTDKVRLLAGLTSGETRMPVAKGQKDSENRAVVAELAMAPSKKKGAAVPDVSIDKLEPTAKIKIDGKLDEEAWKATPLLGPFVDVTTGEPNKTFPVNGKGRILYDDKFLYVGVEVEDKDITGGFPADAKDPHLWTKDTVEIMIDPDWERANTNYYEIQIGPQNLVFDTQWDDYNTPKPSPEGPFGNQDWTAGLKSAVVVDGTIDKSDDVDKGYVVEAAIPWKSLSKAKKSPPGLGDSWRVNLYAMEKNSGVAWSPILGRGNFHRSSRFGRVRWVKKGWAPPAPSGNASAAASGAPAPSAAVAPKAKPSAAAPAPKPAAASAPKPAASAP
jgi:hypothetical protein